MGLGNRADVAEASQTAEEAGKALGGITSNICLGAKARQATKPRFKHDSVTFIMAGKCIHYQGHPFSCCQALEKPVGITRAQTPHRSDSECAQLMAKRNLARKTKTAMLENLENFRTDL